MAGLRTRARSVSVFGILLAGVMGLIASTQTWISVVVADGAATPIDIPGANALALLAPMSLAAMALGIALSIVGRVMRWIFAVLAIVIGAVLSWLTITVITGPPASAISGTVTDATGISGDASVAAMVESLTLTVWPTIALACWVVLIAAGVFALVTAGGWKGAGRKYRAASETHAPVDGPLDSIDSWDDLSRGDDPTK